MSFQQNLKIFSTKQNKKKQKKITEIKHVDDNLMTRTKSDASREGLCAAVEQLHRQG